MFNIDDYRNDFFSMLLAITSFLRKEHVEEDEVWEVARHSETPPHLANILLDLTLSRIIDHFNDDPEFRLTCYVNGCDSHLFLNGEKVNSTGEFIDAYNIWKSNKEFKDDLNNISGEKRTVTSNDKCFTCGNCHRFNATQSYCTKNWPGEKDSTGAVISCESFKSKF